MEVKKTVVGYLEENCYLIKEGNKGLIVDPGDEIDKILNMIGDTDIVGILITHAHFDHIGALDDLLKHFDVPIYYHNINNELTYEKLIDVKEQEYEIDNFIFYLSIGRTDLEYGSNEEMKESINKIKNYSNNITIYPGHGKDTYLGFELKENSYLQ